MDDPPHYESPIDRLARAAARVSAALLRVNRAEEVLTEATRRLALADLVLAETRGPSISGNPPADDAPMDAK